MKKTGKVVKSTIEITLTVLFLASLLLIFEDSISDYTTGLVFFILLGLIVAYKFNFFTKVKNLIVKIFGKISSFTKVLLPLLVIFAVLALTVNIVFTYPLGIIAFIVLLNFLRSFL